VTLAVLPEKDVRICGRSEHQVSRHWRRNVTRCPGRSAVKRSHLRVGIALFVAFGSPRRRARRCGGAVALRIRERTAVALRDARYFGPFGIDGFRYVLERRQGFCALSEINARYTMGFVTGFARHPSERTLA